jgi:hypothetical protein
VAQAVAVAVETQVLLAVHQLQVKEIQAVMEALALSIQAVAAVVLVRLVLTQLRDQLVVMVEMV